MKIKYRKMTAKEITKAKEFLAIVKRVNARYKAKTGMESKRFDFMVRLTLEDKARGWKTIVGDNVGGLSI